jgi:hypothetical protein
MSTTWSRTVALTGVAALLAAGDPARLAAQQPLALGSWSPFEWLDGIGAVDGGGFRVGATTQRIRLWVTDAGFTGDAFNVSVNGALRGATPSVLAGINTGALTGEAAWADPRLSKVELLLDPGQYTVTLATRELSPGLTFGTGFIRADLVPDLGTTVPEPSSAALIAGGLAGMALVLRRRA